MMNQFDEIDIKYTGDDKEFFGKMVDSNEAANFFFSSDKYRNPNSNGFVEFIKDVLVEKKQNWISEKRDRKISIILSGKI